MTGGVNEFTLMSVMRANAYGPFTAMLNFVFIFLDARSNNDHSFVLLLLSLSLFSSASVSLIRNIGKYRVSLFCQM
jgi:ABC-type Na+ efflux pump permease subunit